MTEPTWWTTHKEHRIDAYNNALETTFRHGLNILIAPTIDVKNLTPTPPVAHTTYTGNAEITEQLHDMNANIIRDFYNWKEPTDKTSLFTQAHTNNIVFIRIPARKHAEVTINHHIEHGPFLPTILILAEEHSTSRITLHTTGRNAYLGEDIRILAKNSSSVEMITLQHHTGTSFQYKQAKIHERATVNFVEAHTGAAFARTQTTSILTGKEARTTHYVTFHAKHAQQYDINTHAYHEAPHTYSNLNTRGVVRGESKALSRGTIHITKHAHNSEGYEQQNALILDTAEADAIPILEIHNHDVKCSHGTSIGHLDPERVFYLQSRGLTEEQAQTQIIQGYFTPVLANIPADERPRIMEAIQ